MKVAVVGQGPLSWARFSKKQLRGGEGVLLPLRPLKLKNSEKLLQVPLCNDAKEIFPSPVLTVSRAWASPRAIRTPKLPRLDWIHSCYHLCHRITPVLFPAATCQKVPRLPSLQIDVVWTPEVRWLHSHSVCTALKKKSPKWKHQRDNPPMSQIFTGTEPLVGASEGNWRQRRPRFNQRKEFGDGGMRGFAAVRCPPWIQNITKKYFKQRAAFCPVNTGIYSSLTALALQSASSTIKTQAQFTVTSF